MIDFKHRSHLKRYFVNPFLPDLVVHNQHHLRIRLNLFISNQHKTMMKRSNGLSIYDVTHISCDPHLKLVGRKVVSTKSLIPSPLTAVTSFMDTL